MARTAVHGWATWPRQRQPAAVPSSPTPCCAAPFVKHTEYLLGLDLPLVLVSHDRQLLDSVCTKIVEVERGRTTTFKGNYTQYLAAKRTAVAQQWMAWEAQQREMARLAELSARLAGGANAGRATSAQRELARLQVPGVAVEKPYMHKRRCGGRLVVLLGGPCSRMGWWADTLGL